MVGKNQRSVVSMMLHARSICFLNSGENSENLGDDFNLAAPGRYFANCGMDIIIEI
jgi:hypothetical protein